MRFILLFLLLFVAPGPVSYSLQAKVNLSQYAVSLDQATVRQGGKLHFDSTMQRPFRASSLKVTNYIARRHTTENNTLDFYLLLGLCAILGAIKTIHPKYFNDVWRAFINPTLGSRQLKDIIQAATFPNLLMNVYATTVLGTYVYYLVSFNVDWRFSGVPSGAIVSLLVAGSILMYSGKYLFVQFAGWAFNIRATSEQYNFNIFLVNKILGMMLLPFIVCFAFLDAQWDTPLFIISIILIVVMLLNRYVRSWNIFAQFFMNSRFHFFMYLCAFEILPLAVLIKLVLRIL
ncbi:MAG TPA: DUF4271 domain-containing protein [Chitinophagaceae bacterium]|nr:DUF4271 domain-containing protein [Chitinophagaceae bacterium]